jgi:hypothetical protein
MGLFNKIYMEITSILKSLIGVNKKIKLEELPSKGIFYPNDLEIWIKKASMEDIINYELNFNESDILSIIDNISNIVKNNVILSSGYSWRDTKVLDLVWLFLEIAKFTTNKKIAIEYFDEIENKIKETEFNSKNFNYFDYDKFEKYYDSDKKEFIVDGFRFSFPTLGAEQDLMKYVNSKAGKKNAKKMINYNFNFLFFIGQKSKLSKKEAENLLTIFNQDLEESEIKKVENIIKMFSSAIKYSIRINNREIEISNKINLKHIFKD